MFTYRAKTPKNEIDYANRNVCALDFYALLNERWNNHVAVVVTAG